jgi:hypothetical protein
MSETPRPLERSPTRTIVLALLSVCFPPLGAVLAGTELGSRNYGFGALLILLAVLGGPFVALALQAVK